MAVVCRRLHDDPVDMRWTAGVPTQTGGQSPAGYVCPQCGTQVLSSAVAASVSAYQSDTVTVVQRSGQVRSRTSVHLR